jgi:hypothetical protein
MALADERGAAGRGAGRAHRGRAQAAAASGAGGQLRQHMPLPVCLAHCLPRAPAGAPRPAQCAWGALRVTRTRMITPILLLLLCPPGQVLRRRLPGAAGRGCAAVRHVVPAPAGHQPGHHQPAHHRGGGAADGATGALDAGAAHPPSRLPPHGWLQRPRGGATAERWGPLSAWICSTGLPSMCVRHSVTCAAAGGVPQVESLLEGPKLQRRLDRERASIQSLSLL